jgi:hypothetical protein
MYLIQVPLFFLEFKSHIRAAYLLNKSPVIFSEQIRKKTLVIVNYLLYLSSVK